MLSGLELLIAMTMSFDKYQRISSISILFDIPIVILASIAYSKFDENEDYGQKFHQMFGVFMLVVGIIQFIFVLSLPVLIFLFGLIVPFENKDVIKLYVLLIIISIIILSLSVYFLYLCHLYNKIIIEKSKEKKDIKESEVITSNINVSDS